MNSIDISRPVRGASHSVSDRFHAHSFDRRSTGQMNPLLMVDHFFMKRDTFGWHPHSGISAITYVFEDSRSAHLNQDTMGNDLPIRPGSLHWMVAGSGVQHRECPEGPDGLVHGLQFFVDLPEKLKDAPPYAVHLEGGDIPEVRKDGARVRVVAGEYDGVRSPAALPQPFALYDLFLDPGSELDVPLPAGWGGSVLCVSGSAAVIADDQMNHLVADQAIAIRSTAQDAFITLSTSEAAHLVLLAGKIVPLPN
jgi:redox-sensitive bicupin YhaK (pirin superfamily)